MKILPRYVLREFLVPLTYCLIGFCMIFVLFDMFDNMGRLLDGRPSALFVLRYYLSFLLPYWEWLAPAALMLAALYTMWRFSHNAEITAMRTSGIAFVRITTPILMVAIVMSLATAMINEFLAPTTHEWVRRVRHHRFRDLPPNTQTGIPFYNHAERRIWFIESFDMDNPNLLKGVRVTQERPDRTREHDLVSDHVEYLDGVWWFFNPKVQLYEADDQPSAAEHDKTPSRTLVPMPFFNERPSDFVAEAREWEYLSLRDMMRYLRTRPTLTPSARTEKRYDVFYRTASPWAALVITLFAIPAGVATGRQGVSRGVLLAIGLFLSFFALSQLCMFIGRRGIVPPWFGAWLPNTVFGLAGLTLFARQR